MSDEDEILDFWFGELDEHGCASPTQRKRWWTKSDAFDETIRAKFLSDYDSIVSGERERWRSTPRGALAYIIVLDQFSRNMFRDTPAMFAADPLAREACYEGLDAGFEVELGFDERVFFYLPLEHSEDIQDQQRCHELKADARYYLEYAERHRVIIERFGRYPHRNEILGRVSTDEEIEFLKQPGSSF
jgi:uncharacterized protein (DUF924 family)